MAHNYTKRIIFRRITPKFRRTDEALYRLNICVKGIQISPVTQGIALLTRVSFDPSESIKKIS